MPPRHIPKLRAFELAELTGGQLKADQSTSAPIQQGIEP